MKMRQTRSQMEEPESLSSTLRLHRQTGICCSQSLHSGYASTKGYRALILKCCSPGRASRVHGCICTWYFFWACFRTVNALQCSWRLHNCTCADIVRGSRREIFEKEWAYLTRSE
eukprot:1404268-Rhodomonas_salina.1